MDFLKPTHYLELKLEVASHPRFIMSLGVIPAGADWAEDILGWATSDFHYGTKIIHGGSQTQDLQSS